MASYWQGPVPSLMLNADESKLKHPQRMTHVRRASDSPFCVSVVHAAPARWQRQQSFSLRDAHCGAPPSCCTLIPLS